MIVRISGEDQYLLADEYSEELKRLEGAVVGVVDAGRADGFDESYGALLDYVRTHGTPIGDAEIESSQLILPPADLSFEEAGREFTGEGLIPD
jgi:hypothetical protein